MGRFTSWITYVRSVVDRDKLRRIAIKMHSFKVMEGMVYFEAKLPWGVKQVPNSTLRSGTTFELELQAVIILEDDTCAITIEPSRAGYSGHAKNIYRGPISWLQGVVDYSKAADEDDE